METQGSDQNVGKALRYAAWLSAQEYEAQMSREASYQAYCLLNKGPTCTLHPGQEVLTISVSTSTVFSSFFFSLFFLPSKIHGSCGITKETS